MGCFFFFSYCISCMVLTVFPVLFCSGAAEVSVSGTVTMGPGLSMATGPPGPHGQSALAPAEGGSPIKKGTAIIQSKT